MPLSPGHRTRWVAWFTLATAALAVGAALLLGAIPAHANHGSGNVTVHPEAGTGDFQTLQAAVDHVVAEHGGAGTIDLLGDLLGTAATASIPAGAADLRIFGACDEDGKPLHTLDADADSHDLRRVLTIAAGARVRIECVVITGGHIGDLAGSLDGAGVHNSGTLVLVRSEVSGNTAHPDHSATHNARGGGIFSAGALTIVDSAVLANLAHSEEGQVQGGGLWAEGELTITDSVVAGNRATGGPSSSGWGGGIFSEAHTALVRTVISNNEVLTSDANGGGVVQGYSSEPFLVRNAAFTGNVIGGTVSHVQRPGVGTVDLEWNYWNAGGPLSLDDVEGMDDPSALCPSPECLGALEMEVVGPGSVAYAHAGATADPAFHAALEAYALAYGWDFDDFVTSFGANGAPACGTGETCEWALPLGLVVTLTPTAEDGAAFLGWSCADGTAATDVPIDDPTEPVGCTATFAFPLEITTETLPEAELGALYSKLIESENGIEPVSWDIAASSPFPAWFEFNAGTPGLLSGVPPASGTWSLTVRVTDAFDRIATREFSITASAPLPPPPPLSVSTLALADGTVGLGYLQLLWASGGASPYEWEVTEGTLPPGLELDAASGVIGGRPSLAGTYGFEVSAIDVNAETAAQPLSIVVHPAPPPEAEPASDLVIATTALLDGHESQSYGQYLFGNGGEPSYAWSVTTGALPPGLSLNSETGLVSGTPTAPGTYGFVVNLTDSANATVQRSLGIVVHAAPEPVETPTPPPAENQMPQGCVLNQTPGSSGVYLLVVTGTGCGIGQLPQATSYWVTHSGSFVGFVPGAPVFVNQQFLALFQSQGITTGTPFILVRT